IVGNYSTEFNRFRRMKKAAFLWNIRQIIEAVRPNTAFVVNHLVAEECAEAGGEFIDAPMPEVVGLSATGCMDASAERQLTSLYAGNAPTWGEVKYDAGRTTSQPLAHGLVAMADVTAGVTPILLRDLDALDTDAPEAAAAMFLASRQLNDIYRELRRATGVEYAILLHSLSSFRLFEEETRASFLGIHQFLIEQHLPYRIETEETLRERGFGSAKVLVVANMGRLEAETVRLIEQFVRQGGGLVATATAGARDSDGVLSRPGQLARLLGVEVMDIMQHRHYDGTKQTEEVPVPTMHPADFFFGRVANIEHPIIGTLRGVVIDWTGYLVEVNRRTSSEVLASALDFDQVKINAHYFDRRIPYPGEPRQAFLVVNRLDKGRTAYFAAPVCQTGVRAASDEITALLERAIRWAGAVDPEVVPIRAPMRLRITARKTPQSLLVFLNNLHTVEAPKIVGYAPLAGFDLRCDVQGRSVRRVEDQEGRPVDFRMDGRSCVVKIPRVDVYILARIYLA
ncbi:MAG: beta-galactosidase trimerization domain-containing protein, partial [bacterium]